MSGYLLDTNVVSLLAPAATGAAATLSRLQAWLRANDAQLFLSTITLAEIQAGVSKLERNGALRRAAALAHWLNIILELYNSRTLPLTSPVALEAGRLLDRALAAGANPGFEDAAIAATARVHDLTVVTANRRHFTHFGVAFVSPADLS